MISVGLVLDHVPAYSRSLIKRNVHQIGNLRRAGCLDNVFLNIVINVIRTSYSTQIAKGFCIDNARTHRIILAYISVPNSVRLAHKELRAGLRRRQARIFYRCGCNPPACIFPISPCSRCSYRHLRVKRIYVSSNFPRIEIIALRIDCILIIACDKRYRGTGITGLAKHRGNCYRFFSSRIIVTRESFICDKNRFRRCRNVSLLPLRRQREISLHNNLIARLIGLSIAPQVIHKIVVDRCENIIGNRRRCVGCVGFIHQRINSLSNVCRFTILVNVFLRILRVVGLVYQAIVGLCHGHHGNGRNLVASGAIGAGNRGRTGFHTSYLAVGNGSHRTVVGCPLTIRGGNDRITAFQGGRKNMRPAHRNHSGAGLQLQTQNFRRIGKGKCPADVRHRFRQRIERNT